MSNGNDSGAYTKGFVFGALIGASVGAITALLLAPKSGAELRQELAEKSKDAYDKASDYIQDVVTEVSPKVENTYNEGKMRAQVIVDTAKRQADELISNAENMLKDAKLKVNQTKENVVNKYDNIKDAAKAGVETFKSELNNS